MWQQCHPGFESLSLRQKFYMLKINLPNRLETISFIAGFCLMVFELVAARILAPTIGSSMYVWTSVIGVIIAALSFGYFCGGRLADRRQRQLDITWLLLATAGTMLVTLALYESFLDWLANGDLDARFAGLLASLVLFAPTSFLLGVLSPYLVKFNVRSLGHAGRSVASLSALNAVGGISGTFLTGFVLFSWMGSRQILFALIGLMVATSWLVSPRQNSLLRLAVGLVLVAAGALTQPSLLARPGLVDINTPSAHYQVVDGRLTDGRLIRGLTSGPRGVQSAVEVDGSSDRLVFWYTQELAKVTAAAPNRERILVLGGGTFTLPRFLAHTYPDAQIDVVEIDPGLLPVARNYFNYDDPANVSLIFEDARSYINRTDRRYDVILVDVYGGTEIPFSLMTREFGVALKQRTRPDGVVAANFIGGKSGACRQALDALAAPYQAVFDTAQLALENNNALSSNAVGVFSERDALPLDGYQSFSSTMRPYTDNFAPAEAIQARCFDQ